MPVLIWSTAALAQPSYIPEHREWEATGFVGGTFGTKAGNVRYDSGYLLGVRINQNLGDFWNADLEYSFSHQHVHLTNPSPDIQRLTLNHYLHTFTYDVSYLPLPRSRRFRPYVQAGIGAALFYLPGGAKRDAQALGLQVHDSWKFVANPGGGFKYLVMDEFAVSVDVKDRLSQIPSYGLPGPHGGVLQNWQVNIGFSFQWDEP